MNLKVFITPSIFCSLLFWVMSVDANPSWVKPDRDADSLKKLDFWTGFSLFRSPWVAAPSSTKGRDGLGPLFNARSCDACHLNGSAGNLPGDGFGVVLKISLGNDLKTGPVPLKHYGKQLQTFSIDSITGADQVPVEAKLDITWQTKIIDGIELSVPKIGLSNLGYGDELNRAMHSLRVAPPLFGLGAIDGLTEEQILKREDPNDSNHDGISGRANRVLDRETKNVALGRFGHKAEQPNLRQQVADAFNNDIGLSSWLFPEQTCAEGQYECSQMRTGNSKPENVEITRLKLEKVATFSRLLRPVKRISAQSGSIKSAGFAIFQKVGCAACHVPSLDGQNYIFSDLLLHDMGEPLADNRPTFTASGSEWRTTPLWGMSRKIQKKSVGLLHDGRAATIEQAIFWHDGEAKTARAKYKNLDKKQQEILVNFVQTL